MKRLTGDSETLLRESGTFYRRKDTEGRNLFHHRFKLSWNGSPRFAIGNRAACGNREAVYRGCNQIRRQIAASVRRTCPRLRPPLRVCHRHRTRRVPRRGALFILLENLESSVRVLPPQPKCKKGPVPGPFVFLRRAVVSLEPDAAISFSRASRTEHCGGGKVILPARRAVVPCGRACPWPRT